MCDLYLTRFGQRFCYLTLCSLLVGTNRVVVITEYWSSDYFYYQCIGRQNKKLENEMTTKEDSLRTKCTAGKNKYEKKYAAGKTYQTKCAAGWMDFLTVA